MSIYDIFILLGGVGLFLYGMTIMSSGLKNACGDNLKVILGKATKNKVTSILAGIAVTIFVQSSSATDVMVIGFVTSGLMTLSQAIGVIMGANIGTTVTAQITAFNIGAYAPMILFLGAVMNLFLKNRTLKEVGWIRYALPGHHPHEVRDRASRRDRRVPRASHIAGEPDPDCSVRYRLHGAAAELIFGNCYLPGLCSAEYHQLPDSSIPGHRCSRRFCYAQPSGRPYSQPQRQALRGAEPSVQLPEGYTDPGPDHGLPADPDLYSEPFSGQCRKTDREHAHLLRDPRSTCSCARVGIHRETGRQAHSPFRGRDQKRRGPEARLPQQYLSDPCGHRYGSGAPRDLQNGSLRHRQPAVFHRLLL